MRKKIIQVVGARPNFMKIAPIHRALINHPYIQSVIVHTGQHFDEKMSEVFFNQLELPKPDYFLGVGNGTITQLTSKIMIAFEEVLLAENPDMVIVVGDVTSTLACALTSVRLSIPVCHVEAGLRSFDRTMPEETNRLLTDQISDYLFITESSALDNLHKENIANDKIFFVGNCMIDSLIYYLPKADQCDIRISLALSKKQYALMTMHRPSNVDTYDGLLNIIQLLESTTQRIPVVFPIHPRTLAKLKECNLIPRLDKIKQLIILEPLGYIEFISLMKDTYFILTDSGGIQEESTYLNIPCFTFRKSTERPITITIGSNTLIEDLNADQSMVHIDQLLAGKTKKSTIPPLWDGMAATRIVTQLENIFTIASS